MLHIPISHTLLSLDELTHFVPARLLCNNLTKFAIVGRIFLQAYHPKTFYLVRNVHLPNTSPYFPTISQLKHSIPCLLHGHLSNNMIPRLSSGGARNLFLEGAIYKFLCV